MNDRIATALEERKKVKDKFRAENGYSWDYVMVFKVWKKSETKTSLQFLNTEKQKKQKKYSLKNVVDLLSSASLQTKLFYSSQNDEVYCKVRAPLKRLLDEADRIKYPIMCDPSALANRLADGNCKEGVLPVSVYFSVTQQFIDEQLLN